MEKVITKLTDYTSTPLKDIPLYAIASIIRKDWKKTAKNGVNPVAKPYLDAMDSLGSVKDNYVMSSGKNIVCYFLSNASSWKGDTAREVKKYLQDLTK